MKHSKKLLASALALFAVAAMLGLGTSSFNSSTVFAGFFPADTGKVVKDAQITVNEEDHDFGKIEQNSLAKTFFVIGNSGKDTLEIFSANPSCGCTVSALSKKRIAPGDTAHLGIQFDPHNKAEGPVTKTISVVSNSKKDPQKVLRIHGTIYKSKLAHNGEMMHLDGVFQGNCASCHVEKGKGELGAKLYEADCAICHGSKADNKPGADITSDDMMNHDAKSWKEIISEGRANTNMPAFGLKHKGPLNEEEIASLVDYLGAFKKNLLRERSMKSTTAPKGTN
jgi:mono/diheme cytochrome c family protein